MKFKWFLLKVLRSVVKWPLSLTKLQSKGGGAPAMKVFISADVKGKVCVCTGPRAKENEDSKPSLALKTKPWRLKDYNKILRRRIIIKYVPGFEVGVGRGRGRIG